MPPRPTGTDGSDHAYRMVIAERYQRYADFKKTITRLIGGHVVMAFVKAAWTSIGIGHGHSVPMYVIGTLLGEGAVVGSLGAAKLGQRKENLGMLKLFNLIQAFVTAGHVLSSWRYHVGLNAVQHEFSIFAAKQLEGRFSSYSPDTLLQLTKSFELFIDMTLGAFLLLAVLVSHNMIKEKMEAKREAAEKGARSGGQRGGSDDEGDDAAPPAVPLDDGAASPERRVTAKASMRQRRRIA